MPELAVDFGPRTPPHDLVALQGLVRRLGAPRVVEIGSWLGCSALAMVEAGASRVFCVDTWRGTDDPADETFAAARGVDVYRFFLRNVGVLCPSRIIPCPGESLPWAKAWKWQADLVFLDADHRYEAVAADIAAWTPLVRPGGILCGHDFSRDGWPGVVRAVEESGPYEHIAGSVIWWRQL